MTHEITNLTDHEVQDAPNLLDQHPQKVPRPPKKTRLLFFILFSLFAVFLVVVSSVGLHVYTFLVIPPDQRAEERIMVIERGMTQRAIAEQLHQQGVISDKNLFMLMARWYHREQSLKAGEYKFTTSLLPLEVLRMLQEGRIYLHAVTIPEGYTIAQIADHLAELKYVNRDKFLQLAMQRETAARFQIDANTLEGYLFPETYSFPRNTSEEAIIQSMVNQFWQVMTPDLEQEIRQQGFTIHEIVTLASIIEKEAKVNTERELISAVYHNRLRIKMKLDSDPTVIYGLPDFNGNLTRKDLEQDTPYNTYTRRGLPPGPIANPGKASLLAAIHPADVKYLYFVARNDGTHEFSTTYADHLRAVRKYQLRRKN